MEISRDIDYVVPPGIRRLLFHTPGHRNWISRNKFTWSLPNRRRLSIMIGKIIYCQNSRSSWFLYLRFRGCQQPIHPPEIQPIVSRKLFTSSVPLPTLFPTFVNDPLLDICSAIHPDDPMQQHLVSSSKSCHGTRNNYLDRYAIVASLISTTQQISVWSPTNRVLNATKITLLSVYLKQQSPR